MAYGAVKRKQGMWLSEDQAKALAGAIERGPFPTTDELLWIGTNERGFIEFGIVPRSRSTSSDGVPVT